MKITGNLLKEKLTETIESLSWNSKKNNIEEQKTFVSKLQVPDLGTIEVYIIINKVEEVEFDELDVENSD